MNEPPEHPEARPRGAEHERAGTPEASPGGFVPPPYPYARLRRLAAVAASHEGGVVDLSVGTPCDPPPASVVDALSSSGTERGYPSSVGSEAFREAARRWIGRRFGVNVEAEDIGACVGTKELVASTAWYLRLRRPGRDTVIAPSVAYPTYAMGARLAGCEVFEVPEARGGGVDLRSVPDQVAGRAVLVWLNSPSNPTGSLTDLAAAAHWGRAHDVPVFSDECYCEFTWHAARSTILQAGTEGVMAVHSLSKRSNMAGTRVGFFAGDHEIVGYLSAVRQHAGLMVAGPVQAAAVVALEDDEHVDVQRERYLRRLEKLAAILRGCGLDVAMPAGGFYLWVPVPSWAARHVSAGRESGAWVLTEALARAGGALVSPGDFYGTSSGGWVRVAAVQPDVRIDLVAERLAGSDQSTLAAAVQGDAGVESPGDSDPNVGLQGGMSEPASGPRVAL
ncbi:MAG TPA: aminotransferase class I/II-fold pyridoxal phosphate-dependent enzyme [Acidimicrobiales bacterium]|nr:aminotransferase class I/II-fold pyridoxal phosphate-dependent enzyme [Acidimicrobiales bacterium]